MILEVDLDDLVGESEHDGMAGSHPFLDVDDIGHLSFFGDGILSLFRRDLGLFVAFKITLEVLEQRHLLLQFW